MATFDVEAGRRYLASLPEFRPTKPLSQYKAATIQRKVESFQAQQRAGLPISNRAARGHVITPEHPNRKPRLSASEAAEYRGGRLPKSKYLKTTKQLPRPIIHKRPINPPERLDLGDGAVVDVYYDTAPTLARLRELGEDRVVLTGYDCERGIYRSLGRNVRHGRGWTADALLDGYRASGMSFEDWFISIANASDSDPEQAAERIGHVCIWTLYAYPVSRHLRPFLARQRGA